MEIDLDLDQDLPTDPWNFEQLNNQAYWNGRAIALSKEKSGDSFRKALKELNQERILANRTRYQVLRERELAALSCKGNEIHEVLTNRSEHQKTKKSSGIKKLWKKHKAIIITAVVVVAVTITVVVIVATAGSAAGAGAVAGAAGAAASSKNDKEKAKDSQPPPPPSKPGPKPSLAETAKDMGSYLAHQTLDGAASVVSVIPMLNEEIQAIGTKGHIPLRDGSTPMKNYEKMVSVWHKKIDQAFSTNQAPGYLPEIRAADFRTIGVLPPPGGAVTNVRELAKTGQKVTTLAEELGFTPQKIAQLEKAGTLEKTVARTVENLGNDKSIIESYSFFKKAENFLEPYSKQALSEVQIRDLIQQTGVNTFPRPAGIPENFKVKLSNDGAGMMYKHPENTHISVRVMPGKPHSPNAHQQKPYVVQMKNGKAVDKYGNLVPKESPEAHIPLEEFIYRDGLWN